MRLQTRDWGAETGPLPGARCSLGTGTLQATALCTENASRVLLSLARRELMSLVIFSSRGTQSVGMAEGSEVPDPCSAADAESLLLTLRSSPLQPVSTSPLPVTLDPTVPSLMSPN